MPAILPFIPLIAAGVGAAGVGLSIDQMVNQPSTGPTAAQQQATQNAQNLATQKAAFLSNQAQGTQPSTSNPGAGGLTAATAGGTSPEVQALMTLLNPSGSNSTDISGGFNGTTTPAPQPTNSLASFAI